MSVTDVIAAELKSVVGGVEDYFLDKHGIRVGVAFFLFQFDGDGPSNTCYGSNADRQDMIKAVKEWLDRQEVGLISDPPGPRAQG
jgi:hypothetical protein